jgi:hypothetical protein
VSYYTCKTCGYTGKESEFFDMICPACCANIETGKVVENAIPTVFHKENIFDKAKTIVGIDKANGPDTVVWTTKEGKQIPIGKMATQHIRNTLNMLRENGFIGAETRRYYTSCPSPTAEGALDAFNQEFDRVIEARPTEFIDLFEAELKKRGEKV